MKKPDISDKDRVFVVFLDKDIPGVEMAREEVTVPAGEDANEVCAELLDHMIGNELYTGWSEKE